MAKAVYLPIVGWTRKPGLNISIVRSFVHSANEFQSMHSWAVAAARGLRLVFPHRYVTMPTSPWHIADLRRWFKQCSLSALASLHHDEKIQIRDGGSQCQNLDSLPECSLFSSR